MELWPLFFLTIERLFYKAQGMEKIRTVQGAARRILHIDMDAFFAAVEEKKNPDLKGKLAVIGSPGDPLKRVDVKDWQVIAKNLAKLTREVVTDMRQQGYRTKTVTIKVRSYYHPLIFFKQQPLLTTSS